MPSPQAFGDTAAIVAFFFFECCFQTLLLFLRYESLETSVKGSKKSSDTRSDCFTLVSLMEYDKRCAKTSPEMRKEGRGRNGNRKKIDNQDESEVVRIGRAHIPARA